MLLKIRVTCLLMVVAPFFCGAQISHPIVENRVQSAVSILHVEPEQPVEGMPVIIYFRFTNRTSENLTGWIGADINSGTGTPGSSAVDWEVKDLAPGQYTDGAVFVRAPDAGVNRLIRVFYYSTKTVTNGQVFKSSPMFEIGQQNLNIAALISYSLSQFTINHTRARSTDTDFGSLFVSIDDHPVMQPASKFLGNLQDGTYSFTSNEEARLAAVQVKQMMKQGISQLPVNGVFDTGPFAVVPGINSIVKATYFIYNGGSIDNSDEFLKGFAEATANPQLFNGPRPGREGWCSAMRVLCPMLNVIGACDGFVVADSIMIQTNPMFDVTGRGDVSFEKHFDDETFASQTGCGATSKYLVNSQVRRISHAGTMEQYSPIYASVTAKQNIAIFGSRKNRMDIVWQRVETIAPDGSFITTADPSYGFVMDYKYHAPPDIPKPLLVILRGVQPQLTIDNDEYDVFAGSELRKVTAIIQLIPGQRIRDPNIFNTRPTTTPKTNPPTPPGPSGQKPKPPRNN